MARSSALRRGPAGAPRRPVTVFAGLVVILLLSVLASTMTGARFLSPSEWWRALVAPGADPVTAIVWDMRIPRTAVGLVVGAAYGVAGALMQGLALVNVGGLVASTLLALLLLPVYYMIIYGRKKHMIKV